MASEIVELGNQSAVPCAQDAPKMIFPMQKFAHPWCSASYDVADKKCDLDNNFTDVY